MEGQIYYDNSATTRVRDEVAQEMQQLLCQHYGNPSSLHRLGFDARQRLEKARKQVAASLGCEAESITFTSGGTEADVLAILGGAKALQRRGDHIITTAMEHDAVLQSCKYLESQGWRLTYLQPDRWGNISVQQLLDALEERTVLVSVMAVNNEVGSILPVGEMAKAVHRRNPLTQFHTDCVQAWGKQPLKIGKNLDVDFLTVSSHKIYGPKGVGALYVRKGAKIRPLLFGGGQEKNLRPGTENLPGICGMGLAAELLCRELQDNEARVSAIKAALTQGLRQLPGVEILSGEASTPYILSIALPGLRSEILLHALEEQGVYLSSGSACAKGAPSHVLAALGLERRLSDSALRLSFGRYNSLEEVPLFLEALKTAMARIRRA